MKSAKIYMYERYAGMLREDENGFSFVYDPSYLQQPDAEPISLSMPLREPMETRVFLGRKHAKLLNIAERSWKINQRDRMSLLLACCKDCIGAVSVVPEEEI